MKPKLLICDKCGELHTGEVDVCPVCADGVPGNSVGDECCMCDDGHLVEAAVLPKSVSDEQAAIVAAWKMLPSGYRTTMRAALEAAVAAMESEA